jgi:hypothetical protein
MNMSSFRYLLFLSAMLSSLAVAEASQVVTYEFVPTGDRQFRFGGGLLGIDLRADLAGTFDVVIGDDGAATLHGFDVRAVNVIDEWLFPSVLSEFEPLADRLFVSPEGAEGNVLADGSLSFSSYFDVSEQVPVDPTGGFPIGIFDGISRTSVRLEKTGPLTGRVWIGSFYGLYLDNPSYRTKELGLEVRVVSIPEPAGILIAVIASAVFSATRNRA